jgi:2,3-bisphosphoglycerate-independent phosphoglycerate mutase
MFENRITEGKFPPKTYLQQNNNNSYPYNYSYRRNFSTGDRFFSSQKAYNNPFISFGRKLVLVIADGWGLGKKDDQGNAIEQANPKTVNEILATCPNTKLTAHGLDVGLPEGQMGNSEVGHNHIGGGRIIYQDLTRINLAIKDGSFSQNREFLKAMEYAKKNDSALHLMGLVSPGGIHSTTNHLLELIDMANKQGVKRVYVHAFLDGRDTDPQSAIKYVKEVENKLQEEGYPPIASISGRFYAMDRDNRWDRVEKAYDCLVSGEGNRADSAVKGIEQSYNAGDTDEFVLPTVIGDKDSRIKDKDSVIFFNFRADRAKEITSALTSGEDFSAFERKKFLNISITFA